MSEETFTNDIPQDLNGGDLNDNLSSFTPAETTAPDALESVTPLESLPFEFEQPSIIEIGLSNDDADDHANALEGIIGDESDGLIDEAEHEVEDVLDLEDEGLDHEAVNTEGGEADSEAVDAEDEGVDYDDESDDDEDDAESESRTFMQNRELSWLTFNERVLDQGADESVPLLERLNFISIFWSNLQEFFMVRVGSLTDLSYIEPPVIDSKTGMTPNDQIKAIHERCHELYPIQESTYEHVRGQLAKEGVRHLRPDDLSDEQRNYLFGLIKHNVEPFLSPQIINSRHPFPHLENGKLYILVRLDDEASEAERKKAKKKKKDKDKKGKGGAEGVVLGLIPLPHQCERVIKLPGRGFQFILLEHAIEMFVPEIFSMYKIKHTNVICVTRNADIDANQGFDEQDEDYREHMRRLLKQRARLAPVRLECERPLSPVMEKLMLKKLDLRRFQMYDTIVPLDLSFSWGLGEHLSEKKRARLSNPPFTPAWPTCFDRTRRIMDQVMEHDVLVSYPYESMDPFVQLLREAANDPDVISIKITLYRLASQSHMAEALIAAADAGKEVTALFELRARFDENNNIEWSQRFEQAGCNVLYGFRDYKVHSKICCITRRSADGSIQHITQLGTGNYNEKTARLYTDFSFITADESFGQDAVEFFRNMQLENVSDSYDVLCVAPLQIKQMLIDNFDEQIARAEAGLPASAFMKANSITDKEIMEKISEASNAGVRITLFIRGICCLLPHIKDATENVRVVSIVGRLLEHSRIYCFGPADDCKVYLSSADLMTRNLNKRVEIAWPLPKGEILDKVLSYIDVCMHDTAKLRELRPNATYTPLGAFCDLDEDGNPEPSFDAQTMLIRLASDAADQSSQGYGMHSLTQRLDPIVISEQMQEDLEDDGALGDEPIDVVEESAPADGKPLVIPSISAIDGMTDLTLEEILMPSPAADDSAVEPEPDNGVEPEFVREFEPEPAVEPEKEAEPEQVSEPEPEPEPEPHKRTALNFDDLSTFEAELIEMPIFDTVSPMDAGQKSDKHAETEPEHDSEPILEDAPMVELENEPKIESEAEPEPSVELSSVPEVVPVSESPIEPEPESQPESEPVVESEQEAEPEQGSEPEPEPEPQAALEITSEPEPEPVLEIVSETEPEPEVEQVPNAVIEAEPESQSEVEPAPEIHPESNAKIELDSEPDLDSVFAPEIEVEPGHVYQIEPQLDVSPEQAVIDAASSQDRVSELIAQLSASPNEGQIQDTITPDSLLSALKETAIDETVVKQEPEAPLTDMTIDDILSSPEPYEPLMTGDSAAPVAPENNAMADSTAPTIDQAALDLQAQLAGSAPNVSVPETPAMSAAPEPAASPEITMPSSQTDTQQASAEPESASAPETAPSAQKAAESAPEAAKSPEEEVQGFFEGSHREIEMPPDKKQGFFARFRK